MANTLAHKLVREVHSGNMDAAELVCSMIQRVKVVDLTERELELIVKVVTGDLEDSSSKNRRGN